MRVLILSSFFAAIAVAENLFLDSPSLDDTPLLWENQDITSGQLDASDPTSGQLDFSDPSLLTAYAIDASEPDLSSLTNSPELEISSCTGTSETSDSQSWSKLRARDACAVPDQPHPFQDRAPDWLTDLGDKFKDLLGVTPKDEFRPRFLDKWIDETKCIPDYIYNLCCATRESFTLRIFMGNEVSGYYDECYARMFFQADFLSKTSFQLIYVSLAAGCLFFDVCCRGAVYFVKGRLTGVECYQVSSGLPFEHFNPPTNF